MYTDINFKTKKALKDAVSAGKKVTIFSPGFYPAPENGRTTIEGPHYPEPHRWYASVILENGIIVKVLS